MTQKPIKVRQFKSEEITLEQLAKHNLGLYFPLSQLDQDELDKLEALLSEIKMEPIALAHSAATDDDD
jgi:hypothetical protein